MKRITLIVWGAAVVLAVGCATQHSMRRASVVDFLYPKKANPVDVPGPTVMELPLRVGVVFVPETRQQESGTGLYQWATPAVQMFTDKDKVALLGEVARSFRQYPFVKSVELIPSQYLQPGGGFENLDQLRTMFGTEVVVLLSYDQAQFTDEGVWTLTYWTVVGAYLVEAERNTTKTMMDAVVYHLPNRKLLFRAPGVSEVKARATPVNLSAELRADSLRGFQLAATNLVTNLQEQLAGFKDRIKEEPQEFKVVAKPGYDLKAVGQVDVGMVLLLTVMVGGLLLCKAQNTSRG